MACVAGVVARAMLALDQPLPYSGAVLATFALQSHHQYLGAHNMIHLRLNAAGSIYAMGYLYRRRSDENPNLLDFDFDVVVSCRAMFIGLGLGPNPKP